jgi:hypothetical protein
MIICLSYIEPQSPILGPSLSEISDQLLNLGPRIDSTAGEQISVDPVEACGICVFETLHCHLINRSIFLPAANDCELDTSASQTLEVTWLEVVSPIRSEIYTKFALD